jgi:ectoine hydroxylase-related dioxygenase (phytanoyl-CoA dioxygenase family)
VSLLFRVRSGLLQARSRIEPGVRRALFGDRPTWQRRPNVLPWFDRPDAMAQAERGPHADLLTKWVRDGYVVVDDVVDRADVDAMIGTLDGLWDAPTPVPHLELLSLREERGAPFRTVPHAEVLTWDAARRERVRQASDWRIHGFHYVNDAARRIFRSATLRRTASLLFGRRARPIAAINFMTGSQQDLHQDMAVFHIWPQNWLMGAWIACEDIAPHAGPLVFHPGSHRAPFFPGFTEYPQSNLRTVDEATAHAYQRWVDEYGAQYPRHEFLGRKGQVLFWHGMLIHGGAAIGRPGTTRKSMVIHYSVRGADRGREVRGPFRW